MSIRVRSFTITGEGDQARADEEHVSRFLRNNTVDRIETVYADGAWRLLVMFNDSKSEEEAKQISAVLASALKGWRREMARNMGETPEALMSDDMLNQVAKWAPTTSLELRLVLGTGAEPAPYENEIVAVVRQSLDDLA